VSEPVQHGWRMPAETEPHECTWMAFPPASPALGGNADEIDTARTTWTRVAHTILEFEPVIMVADPADVAAARSRLSREVTIVEQPLNDAWMRDIGLTFVLDAGGRLGGVDWSFNGWGGQAWASWDLDSKVAAAMADVAGCAYLPSSMVNEGGGIHVDGLGTVLVTETVQLDPGRNPGMSKADVERELATTIGAEKAIWLRRGLTRDYEPLGTRGHVDIVATFPSPGTVLVHDQRNPEHPDHAVTAEVVDALSRSTDVLGRPLQVVRLPAPATLRDRAASSTTATSTTSSSTAASWRAPSMIPPTRKRSTSLPRSIRVAGSSGWTPARSSPAAAACTASRSSSPPARREPSRPDASRGYRLRL
jgi:agmatine deiminase